MAGLQIGRLVTLPLLLNVLLFVPALAQQPSSLALDSPTEIAGVEAVFTGVGLDAREDPRWGVYPLKVEIAGEGGRYLGDENVVLRQGDRNLLAFSCCGPWLLFHLPAGRYEVQVQIGDQTVSSPAYVPATGQGYIILRFAEGNLP